jgi:hypothetical protein
MRKKMKRLKITEEMMNEIINSDGGIISGGMVEYPGSSRIKTTTYDDKIDGTNWDTDKQRWSANQDGKFYYYFRGYGYSSGSVSESYIIEDDLREDTILDRFKNSKEEELISKDTTSIPDIDELSKSYDMDDVQDNVKNLIDNVDDFSNDENYEDIVSIIVKNVIEKLNTKNLSPKKRKELKNSI